MKKVLALVLAMIMTFGAYGTVFAQTVTNGIKYNIVVDGEKKTFTDGEAIVVDELSMFTVECYTNKFGCESITAEIVTQSAKPFSHEGKDYYALRDVAAAAKLNVFWDATTKTALVIDQDIYEQIKALIDASNTNNPDFKKVEMEMNGNLGMTADVAGQSMNLGAPFSADVKMDIEVPYLEMAMKIASAELSVDTEVKVYDDGEKMYISNGESWISTASSLADSKEMIDQIKEMNPAKNELAEALSIAGLKLAETADGYVIEGDMYIGEMFKSIDFDAMMQEAYSQIDMQGMDFNFKYNWPNTMYVKYVMDKEGAIKSMSMKFELGMVFEAGGEKMEFNMNADVNVPKFVIDGSFETVVPQEVKDAAVDAASSIAE